MTRAGRVLPAVVPAVLALTLAAAEGLARADMKSECVSASTSAQTLRDEGKLRASREKLLVCAKDECPSIVKKACGDWLADLERRLPSLVLRVSDGPNDVTDVKVFLDGTLVAERIEGTPLTLDPGDHTLRFERGGTSLERKVMVAEGERGRVLPVQLQAKNGTGDGTLVTPPVVVEARRPVPIASIVLLGVGLAGLASFTYFGVTAKYDVDNLRSTCAPNCAAGDVSDAKTKAVVADISLGVGVVALGIATVLFLTRPNEAAPSPASATNVSVWPTRGGAGAGFSTRF